MLDLYCLNSLCDDYENVSSIRDDVVRAARLQVNEQEIERCLEALAREGMVSVFRYDAARGEFLVDSESRGDYRERWFLITAKGRVRLKEAWPPV